MPNAVVPPLADLAALSLHETDLAYLVACQTATGDLRLFGRSAAPAPSSGWPATTAPATTTTRPVGADNPVTVLDLVSFAGSRGLKFGIWLREGHRLRHC